MDGHGGEGEPHLQDHFRRTVPGERDSRRPRGSEHPAEALTRSSRSSGAGWSKSWILSSMHVLSRSDLLLLLQRGFRALDCG